MSKHKKHPAADEPEETLPVEEPVAAPVPEPEPVPAPAPAPVPTGPRNWRVNFRSRDTGGIARAHPWLPLTLTVEGCVSADEARAKLLALFENAIFQIDPEV